MAKDPAALFYIDKWLVATKEMKADCRGWYLNLVMHQFDKKDLPDDIEELANLCDVRVSEFEHFKQVFEQVLKHKFKKNSRGRLENDYAKEIITNRENFKEKRSNAGKISYFSKFMRKICKDENIIRFVIQHTDFNKLDTKSEQVLKQVFEQTSKLYINENVNVNVIKDKDISSNTFEGGMGETLNEEREKKIVEATEVMMKDFKFISIANPNKQRQISDFIRKLFAEKRIEYFIEQYPAYWQYKKLSGSQTQGLDTFINGGWDRENWVEKLKEFNRNGTKPNSAEEKKRSRDELAAKLREMRESNNGSFG